MSNAFGSSKKSFIRWLNVFAPCFPQIWVSANKDAHKNSNATNLIPSLILPAGTGRKHQPNQSGPDAGTADARPRGAGMNNPASSPTPPSLHWAIVLLLDVLTLGLFGFFWMFRQAQFARKIDPTNRAVFQILLSVVLFLVSFLLASMVTLTVARGGQPADLGSVMNMLRFFQILMVITAYLQIRKSLHMRYGIQLNPLLTVIFNVLYVQYHLSKLAKTSELPIRDAVLPNSRAGSATV
jgi:hypothetical protein